MLTEIENGTEDYQGIDPTHNVPLETKLVTTDQSSRIVIPAYGSFFTGTLQVRDINSKLPLTLGHDYKIGTLDERASLKSGKEVITSFVLTNVNITGIEYSYHYVGGLHSNGKYLLDLLKKQYPDGIKPNQHWDHIKSKPDQFKGNPHQHSVYDTYGYDEAKRQLSRVIVGINHGTDESLANMYVRADIRLNELETRTAQEIADIRSELLTAFEMLRVQQGEYIFTDSPENPSIIRGYGTWVRIVNTVLRGAQTDLIVGDGTIISTGTRQALRNTYIWMNKDNGVQPTASLFIDSSLIINDVVTVREGQEFEIGVSSSMMVEGTRLDWIIEGIGDEFIDETVSKRFGTFVLDNLGQAKQKIRFKDDPYNIGDRTCVFMLEHLIDVKYDIKILDTTRARWCELTFTHDPAGIIPAVRVNEGNMVYLQIKFHGYDVGETVYLDWTAGTIPDYDFDIKPISIISATASTFTMGLKIKANELTDGERALIVYAKNSPDEAISNKNTMAYALVSDASTGINIQIDFKKSDQIITNIGEGETFDVLLTTDLPVGSVVDLTYESSKPLNEFTGLIPTTVIGINGKASFPVQALVDFLSNDGVQLLKLTTAFNQKDVSENTIIIRDTSQTPNYDIIITKPNQTTATDKVNEGDAFWVRIKVSNWVDTSNPPTLVFGYGLDNDLSQNSGVSTRVQSTFHNQLEFSNASAVYDDVEWVNGELIIAMVAIADHRFSGNKLFNIAMKQNNMDQFLLQTSVMIMDTSVLDVTAAWSSSAVMLNPITQVNEMQSDGTNNTMYLWLDVIGDGSLFGDITVHATGQVTTEDLVTVFPNVMQFDIGSSRRIFAITLAADFLNEGDEILTCYGTYVDVDGQVAEIFRTSILIIDNSIQIPLDVKLSTSNVESEQPPLGGKWSEYSTIYAHVSFPAYALATKVAWEVTGNPTGDASMQFQTVTGSLNVDTGSNKVVIPIQPIADRVQDGEFAAYLSCKRQLQSDNKVIGTGGRGFTLMDDSLPTTIDTKFYNDPARTNEASIFNEGDVVYGRTIVTNPYGPLYLINNVNRTSTQVIAGNVYLGMDSNIVDHPEQRIVKAVYDVVGGNTSYTSDFQLNLKLDRNTENRPQLLQVGGMLVDNSSAGLVEGDISPVVNSMLELESIKTLTVVDTSKTAIHSVSISPTLGGSGVSSIAEGEYFYLTLRIQSGEVGDVYTVSKSNTDDVFPLSRFDYQQFGIEQVQSLVNDQITWRFRVKLDRDTNTSNIIKFSCTNKTTGLVVAVIDFEILDIYKTPTLEANYFLLSDGIYSNPNPISERTPPGGQQYLVVVGDEYLLSDDAIKITYLSGRPEHKWDPMENWNKPYPVVALGSDPRCPPSWRNRNGVIIPIKPTQDRQTNPPMDLAINLRVSTIATSAILDMNFDISDTSQTRTFFQVWWADINGYPRSSINEGETAVLRVSVTGGQDIIDVLVTNNGGRSIDRLSSHEYGVTKSRSSNLDVLEWRFTPSLDYLDNIGAEGKLSVRVEVPDTPGLIRDIELPIVDLSASVTGGVTFHAVNSTNVISYLMEGKRFGPVFDVYEPNPNDSFRMITKSNRSGSEWAVDTILHGYQLINLGGGHYRYKFQREVYADQMTNTPEQLYLTSELWHVETNTLLASGQLTIIDSSREEIDPSNIRITNPSDGTHTHINSIGEGNTVRLWFSPQCFVNTDWNQKAYAWEASSGDITPQSGYLWQHSLAADGSFSVDVTIPANEATDGDRDIRINLYEVFDGIGGVWSWRGMSNPTTILDTSPLPAISAAFFSKDANPSDNPTNIIGDGVTINEGDTVYLHVWAKGLTADGSGTNVNIGWGGTATQADFDTPLPSQIWLTLWNASSREYKGVSGPLVIKNDQVQG